MYSYHGVYSLAPCSKASDQTVLMGRDSIACKKPSDNLGEGYQTAARLHYRKIKKEGLLMVYVQSQAGQPLMPTSRHGKVRRLLKEGKAKVVKRCPFTIKLLYETTTYTQELALGIDAGSRHIGLSVTSDAREYYAGEVELRNDIVDLLATRRETRRSRRNRKTRYRKPRFNNRRRSDGWIAPSVQNKIDSHLTVVKKLCGILPIRRMIVEVASFDLQKIKNPEIEGTGYQQGEQLGFWNVREYVLFRDGHICQCCHGKSKDRILNVHHIESRKTGGNAPNNLITLCESCHKDFHKGKVILPSNIRRGIILRDAAFMGIMRWAFFNALKAQYPNVSLTYGYLTKNTRITNGLEKTHCVDARCISGHPKAAPMGVYYFQKKIRCHNRQTHKANPQRGIRKRNQAPYLVKDFRLFDKVSYDGTECFIYGRRASGYFDLRKLDGTVVHCSASYKKLKLLEPRSSYLTERRKQAG